MMKFWRVVYEIPTSYVVQFDYENIEVTLDGDSGDLDIDRRDVYEMYTHAPNMVAAQFKATEGLDQYRIVTVERISFWQYLKERCIRTVYDMTEGDLWWS